MTIDVTRGPARSPACQAGWPLAALITSPEDFIHTAKIVVSGWLRRWNLRWPGGRERTQYNYGFRTNNIGWFCGLKTGFRVQTNTKSGLICFAGHDSSYYVVFMFINFIGISCAEKKTILLYCPLSACHVRQRKPDSTVVQLQVFLVHAYSRRKYVRIFTLNNMKINKIYKNHGT